jgi:hypothetical protein
MSYAGPQTLIFVIGVDWSRWEKPKPPRHHKAKRELWKPQTGMPKQAQDQHAVREGVGQIASLRPGVGST